METIDTCPQCARSLTNGPTSCRLVQDSCGHKKCRLCILNDENSCKQCLEGLQVTAASNSNEIDHHPTVITYQKKSDVAYNASIPSDNNRQTFLIAPETSSNISSTQTLPEAQSTSPSDSTASVPEIDDGLSKQSIIDSISNAVSKTPKHIKYDSIKQEFTCTICSRSFTTKSQIRYHDYCGGDKKPFHCDVCNKGFIVKSHFTTHLLAHQNLKPYKCMECGKTFFERSKLNRHKLSHTASRPHMCQVCGKTFKIKENLRTHSLIHRQDKPYNCPDCDLKFSHSSNLKKHLTVHTSDKAHMCDQCGKRFKLKWALTLHRRVHLKTRPNQCVICSKTFVHQKDLARHELIHAETKSFRCGICDTRFKRKDNLSRHTRNAHPGRKPQVIKCVDNPNAINVITSYQDSSTPAQCKLHEGNNVPDENRQQVNGPLKLALKTPTFKNNYNIHRNYVQPNEGKQVNIYEKIMNPRMPATLISTASSDAQELQQEESNIMQCQWTLGPLNAPLHYESSFKENAVIKNIKFKLPAKYTNLSSRESSRSATNVLNAILNVGEDEDQSSKAKQQATTSVIVNSAHTAQTHLNNMQDVHWRKRNAQFIAAKE